MEVIAITLLSVIFLALSCLEKKIKQSICHLPSLSVNNTVLHLKVIKRYSKTLNTPDLILSILLTELLFLQHKLHQPFYRPTRTVFLDQPYPKLKYTGWKPEHSLQNKINPYIVFSQIPGNEVGIFSNNHPATRSVIVFLRGPQISGIIIYLRALLS